MKIQLPDVNQFRRDAVVLAKVLAPVVAVSLIGFYFHTFVVNAILANIYINLGIICAAFYGVVLIVIRLVSAQGDFRVIERFGREALKGVYMNQLLNEPWMKNRYVRHYLAHIAQTGGTISSQLDQNAIHDELAALSEEYNSKLELPQFLVGFMIAMGLLGTFIGLLETLTGISGMLDGLGGGNGADIQQQFMKLVVELRKPLAGMGIAFSASMFGLITSLMLAIMMTNLRRYVNRVIAVARNVMHDLVELRRPSSSTSVTSSGGGDGVSQVSAASAVSGNLLASRVEVLTKKIELLMEMFEGSISGTQKLNELLGFGPRMKETSERTLEEIRNISHLQGEQQGIAERALEELRAIGQMNSTQQHVSERTLEEIKNIGLMYGEQKPTSERMLGELKSMVLMIGEQKPTAERMLDELKNMLLVAGEHRHATERALEELKSIGHMYSDQQRVTQKLIDVNVDGARSQNEQVRTLQKLLDINVESFKALDERLARIEDVDVGGAKHLWAIKETLIKLCQSLGVVELVSTGVGQQTILLETLVEEVRTSQKSLVAIQQGMNRDFV